MAPGGSRLLWLSSALLAAVAISRVAAAEKCCTTCLAQTDPKSQPITYDPIVFSQCSAAKGICCYGCDFSHGAPNYQSGVSFGDEGAAQTTAGTRVVLTINSVERLTYDFLAKNQVKNSFVGNQSTQVLAASDGSFSICARSAGTLAFRGWGADSCREVTNEYTISVLAGDGTATCDAATVKPPSGSDDTSTKPSSGDDASTPSTSKPNQPVVPQGDGESINNGGENDVDNCSTTRGSVRNHDNGSKYCECVGDWRNPPLCDSYSWTKTIITILGAVAAVLSIAFSVHAYLKSKKAEREAQNKDLDVTSENELETMRISPAKRDASSASPAPAIGPNSSRRSPARTPLTATAIRTSGHETTL